MKKEFFFTFFSFGMSSLFWLYLAYLMNINDYGLMMKLQAIILPITAVFSLRTYDLYFFLLKKNDGLFAGCYKTCLSVELLMFILYLIFVFLLSTLTSFLDKPNFDFTRFLLPFLLSGLVIFQNSAQALIRSALKDKVIYLTEFISGFFFLLGIIFCHFYRNVYYADVLLYSIFVASLRPVILVFYSFWLLKLVDFQIPLPAEARMSTKQKINFLLVGQFTNLIKNNQVYIETILLSQFVGLANVSVFRISKSFINITTVLLNINYQRSYRLFVSSKNIEEIKSNISRVNKKSILLWLISIPIMLLVAIAFLYLKGGRGYNQLIEVLLLSCLGLLPLALQQANFAYLTVIGKNTSVFLANFVSISILIIFIYILPVTVTIYSFLIITILAAWVRYFYLRTITTKCLV